MGLTTLLPQLISILRAKLLKVFTKFKNVMFFTLFLKMHIFEVVTFFLTQCLSNRFNLSVAVRKHKIHVFEKASFFLAIITRYLKIWFFSVSIATIVKETNYLITIMQLNNPHYPWKIGIKQRKATPENCGKGLSSTTLLRTHTLTIRSKCSKNYFPWFYYHL